MNKNQTADRFHGSPSLIQTEHHELQEIELESGESTEKRDLTDETRDPEHRAPETVALRLRFS